MPKPPPLGTVNGRIASPAKLGRKRFVFDGTTLGLVRSSLDAGAKDGSIVSADYGGGMKRFRLVRADHDDRAGYWVEPVRNFA